MKPSLPALLLLCSSICYCFGQTPQIAVVKPNGTTTIHSTWASAYDAAANNDFIYLPGMTISGNITIDKKLFIFGAGHHPDSSSVTGITTVQGNLTIHGGASNGSISGLKVTGLTLLGGQNKLTEFHIFRCFFVGQVLFNTTNAGDSIPEYITISDCILPSLGSNNTPYARNNMVIRSIFFGFPTVYALTYCTFYNNIFHAPEDQYSYIISGNVSFTTFYNNIFLQSSPMYTGANGGNCYNSFFNNLKIGNSDFNSNGNCPNQGESNNVTEENIDSIFINVESLSSFSYSYNYFLTPNCIGNNAGSDGTDVGIYGTSNPTPAGWLPSNPHIYFKQIDAETGPDGKLHIQVGVRTQNE